MFSLRKIKVEFRALNVKVGNEVNPMSVFSVMIGISWKQETNVVFFQ